MAHENMHLSLYPNSAVPKTRENSDGMEFNKGAYCYVGQKFLASRGR